MHCVRSVTYSVIINENTHGFIKPERGIRQGDTLSPFLFILCAEALVHVLNKAENRGGISGIRTDPLGLAVHHLLFVDYRLLMCKATSSESNKIKRCLRLYRDASGQVINNQKSSIILGSKIREEDKTVVKQILRIIKEGGEGKYLGLPGCLSGSKRQLLNFIRENLQARLHGWFSKSLSQGGKEVLLKSVEMVLSVYAMSCFKLPQETCKKITSAMTKFWWSSGKNKKKISWVAWKKLCQQKMDGVLGFRDIGMFNQALLCKYACRIWDQPNALLSRILKSRYFKNRSMLDSGPGTRPSYAWRSILFGKDLLKNGLLKQIGNGLDTSVWFENWILDEVP